MNTRCMSFILFSSVIFQGIMTLEKSYIVSAKSQKIQLKISHKTGGPVLLYITYDYFLSSPGLSNDMEIIDFSRE